MLEVQKFARKVGAEFRRGQIEINQAELLGVDKKPGVELVVNQSGEFVEPQDNLPDTAPALNGNARLYIFTAVGSCLLALGTVIGVNKIQEVIDGTPCNPGPDQLAVDVGQKNTLKAKLDDANARSKYPFRFDNDIGISIAGLALGTTAEHLRIIEEIDAAYRGFSNLNVCEFLKADGSESDIKGFVIQAKVKENIDDATWRLDQADQRIKNLNMWVQAQLQPVLA